MKKIAFALCIMSSFSAWGMSTTDKDGRRLISLSMSQIPTSAQSLKTGRGTDQVVSTLQHFGVRAPDELGKPCLPFTGGMPQQPCEIYYQGARNAFDLIQMLLLAGPTDEAGQLQQMQLLEQQRRTMQRHLELALQHGCAQKKLDDLQEEAEEPLTTLKVAEGRFYAPQYLELAKNATKGVHKPLTLDEKQERFWALKIKERRLACAAHFCEAGNLSDELSKARRRLLRVQGEITTLTEELKGELKNFRKREDVALECLNAADQEKKDPAVCLGHAQKAFRRFYELFQEWPNAYLLEHLLDALEKTNAAQFRIDGGQSFHHELGEQYRACKNMLEEASASKSKVSE